MQAVDSKIAGNVHRDQQHHHQQYQHHIVRKEDKSEREGEGAEEKGEEEEQVPLLVPQQNQTLFSVPWSFVFGQDLQQQQQQHSRRKEDERDREAEGDEEGGKVSRSTRMGDGRLVSSARSARGAGERAANMGP